MTVRLMSKPTASAALVRRAAWVADPAVQATAGSTIITARAGTPRSAAISRRVSTSCLRQSNAPAARAGYIRASPSRRSYHSYDHPPNPNPFTETEQALLSAAYAHVPEHGFTQHALAQGARDAGYLDISPSILPDGPFALIRWHLVTQRLALANRRKELFGTDNDPSDVDRKVAALAWARLQGNEAVIAKWQQVKNQ
jgi:ubiquinone biosynthesis protein COQ9